MHNDSNFLSQYATETCESGLSGLPQWSIGIELQPHAVPAWPAENKQGLLSHDNGGTAPGGQCLDYYLDTLSSQVVKCFSLKIQYP